MVWFFLIKSILFTFIRSIQVPYLEQIDDIERTVNKLEDCAYQLDAYSQKLEQKFNNITKKKWERLLRFFFDKKAIIRWIASVLFMLSF